MATGRARTNAGWGASNVHTEEGRMVEDKEEESREALARRCVAEGKAEAVHAFCDAMGIAWTRERALVAAGLSASGLRALFASIRREGKWPAKVDADEFPHLIRTWFAVLGLEWTQEREDMATGGEEAQDQLILELVDAATGLSRKKPPFDA